MKLNHSSQQVWIRPHAVRVLHFVIQPHGDVTDACNDTLLYISLTKINEHVPIRIKYVMFAFWLYTWLREPNYWTRTNVEKL
jgi:hypothetical protein